jgi:23S rRNA (cytosine1962-C5)-methyltransferase
VHAEGDGLPGLIVDRYGDVLAVQLGTIGMKQREALVYEALQALLAPRAILDRTGAQTAKTEGFEPASGVVRGDPQLRALEAVERGLRFRIPLELGQKTGFYFDQRPLRARVEELARGKRVLDAYSFVGAIAISAARGGASEVVAIDESASSSPSRTRGACWRTRRGRSTSLSPIRRGSRQHAARATRRSSRTPSWPRTSAGR